MRHRSDSFASLSVRVICNVKQSGTHREMFLVKMCRANFLRDYDFFFFANSLAGKYYFFRERSGQRIPFFFHACDVTKISPRGNTLIWLRNTRNIHRRDSSMYVIFISMMLHVMNQWTPDKSCTPILLHEYSVNHNSFISRFLIIPFAREKLFNGKLSTIIIILLCMSNVDVKYVAAARCIGASAGISVHRKRPGISPNGDCQSNTLYTLQAAFRSAMNSNPG